MLFGWMKSLVLYLLLSGIAINLTPNGNYKRYVTFFSGIVVIVILIKPISFVMSNKALQFIENISLYNSSDYFEKYIDINNDYSSLSVKEIAKLKLKEAGYEIKDIEVIYDKKRAVKKITVVINNQGNEVSEAEIKLKLKEVYSVEADSIYIVKR